MATVDVLTSSRSTQVHHGGQDIVATEWEAFSWEEPDGTRLHGEAAILRPDGSSGTLMAGLWRSYVTAPGAEADGSQHFLYSSAGGDEVEVVIEGYATLTEIATGQKHRISPGSIVSCPKGLKVRWDVEGPYFKKFWCVFDGTQHKNERPTSLLVSHVNAEHVGWRPFQFVDADGVQRTYGEIVVLRDQGSTGSLMCGLWRGGVGIEGCEAYPAGQMTMAYNAPLGDETMLLLEGSVEIVEHATGRHHTVAPGDITGLTTDCVIDYTSRGVFAKKFWVVTRDQ